MKKLSLIFILSLILSNDVLGQTFHTLGIGMGGGLLPLTKEFSKTTDGAFKSNLLLLDGCYNYSTSKFPIEFNIRLGTVNKRFGEYERDAIYEPNGQAQSSIFDFTSRVANISFGLNFFLFKNNRNVILSPPDHEVYSSNKIK